MKKTNADLISVGWQFVMLGITLNFNRDWTKSDIQKIMRILNKHGKQIKREVKAV